MLDQGPWPRGCKIHSDRLRFFNKWLLDMLCQKRGGLLGQDIVFHHVDLNPEEKNDQPQCKIMISIHFNLPIYQRLPRPGAAGL